MSSKTKSIQILMDKCLLHLKHLGYSDERITRYYSEWSNGILSYMQERNIVDYSPEIGEMYLKQASMNMALSTECRRRRNIYILNDFLETNDVRKKIFTPTVYPLQGAIGSIAQDFLHELKLLRLKDKSLDEYQRVLSYFISGLELKSINSISDIQQEDVTEFIYAAQKSKSIYCKVIRRFCNYLYVQKLTDVDLAYVVNTSRLHIPEKIPSVYTVDEVVKIENSVEQSSPVGKRDYAILLLASRLGLRSSDIRNLTFSNLDWDSNKITITQFKTGKLIELPLLPEVGEAIVNYIRYARPKSNRPEIFLTFKAPYRPLLSMGLTESISKIMRQSGVDTSNRKIGPHSMRHTLASRLLHNGVALPIISETLGHQNTQTTMEYIRVDIRSLVKCTLTVPIVDSQFYSQKGGVFYE